ncbi:MAG: sigma-54 dependent transcriptional regulator [Candidatus Delongbacteria bacterium]|nr:sigma-54 dependent transcriptional regulator [Candidatus Delongbacteria bacterium]MCG2761282.1 sigma-54 dependent transcriptional regulator [Candidatus Delongbacteria bacterium]
MSLKQLNMNFGPNYKEYDIIGYSEKISEAITIIKTIAPTGLSVLISGESGTGKEIIAQLIHNLSDRKNHKFIPINCGAIPEGLIENELFGHEKGSYTSASEKSKGYFEVADKGTIFLDEIGELPLSSQVKLLRVLENGTFMKVGGSQNITVDVRIVAATNKNLLKMVEKGLFREDLYFRLKAVSLQLPSLRERLADIPLFVLKFAKDSAEKYKRTQLIFDKESFSEIANHQWKGNIRELKNFIDMLTVMETGKTVTGEIVRKYLKTETSSSLLPMLIRDNQPERDSELIFKTLLEIKNDLNLIKKFIFNSFTKEVSPSYFKDDIEEILDPSKEIKPNETLTEKDEISQVLKKYRGNRRRAAEELNMSERTLYRKIEKYGIET